MTFIWFHCILKVAINMVGRKWQHSYWVKNNFYEDNEIFEKEISKKQLLCSSKFLFLPGISLKIVLVHNVNSDLCCWPITKLLMPLDCFYCFKCAIYLCVVLVSVHLFMYVLYLCYETVYAYDFVYVCMYA